jgi:hypothetical protein
VCGYTHKVFGNEGLYETDDNGVWVVNFSKSNNPIYLHTLGLLLMGRLTDRSHGVRKETAFKYT